MGWLTAAIVMLGLWVAVLSPPARKREMERAEKERVQNEEFLIQYHARCNASNGKAT